MRVSRKSYICVKLRSKKNLVEGLLLLLFQISKILSWLLMNDCEKIRFLAQLIVYAVINGLNYNDRFSIIGGYWSRRHIHNFMSN